MRNCELSRLTGTNNFEGRLRYRQFVKCAAVEDVMEGADVAFALRVVARKAKRCERIEKREIRFHRLSIVTGTTTMTRPRFSWRCLVIRQRTWCTQDGIMMKKRARMCLSRTQRLRQVNLEARKLMTANNTGWLVAVGLLTRDVAAAHGMDMCDLGVNMSVISSTDRCDTTSTIHVLRI